MPSTYTVNLGIEKPATGEQSGTWGDTTNTNFDILDQGINGAVRVTLTSAGSSGSPNALQITNGAASDGRNKWIEFYSSGDLGGSAYVQLDPNDAEKIVFIRNSLASSRSVLLFQGTYSASRDLEIPAGVDMVVKFDGGGASAATVTDVYTKLRATEITTPTLTATTADINGDLTLTGASYNAVWDSSDSALEFADNAKAIFGAGSDLQIYHDGSNSYIKDNGTGDLKLQGNNFTVGNTADTKYFTATNGGGVELYHQGNEKLATTSGGINVTGTVTSDGADLDGAVTIKEAGASVDFRVESDNNANMLFVDGSADSVGIGTSTPTSLFHINAVGTGTRLITFEGDLGTTNNRTLTLDTPSSDDGNAPFLFNTSNSIAFAIDGTERLRIDSGGNFVFNELGNDVDFRVESNNNANMLFVDGGTDRVGIGTNAPGSALHVSVSSPRISLTDTDTGADHYINADSSVGNLSFDIDINSETTSPAAVWNLKGTERMRLTTAGSLGIGTSSPVNKLSVNGSITLNNYYETDLANAYYDGSAWKYAANGVAWGIGNNFGGTTNGTTIAVASSNSGGPGAALTWSPAFNIDSGGDVGIGATTIAAKLHVDAPSTTAPSLTFGATAGQIFQNENSELAIGLSNSSPYPLWIQGRTSVNAARDIVLQPLGGSVGIGTSSPGQPLEILSNTAEVSLNSSSSTYSRVVHEHNGTAMWTTGTRAATDYHIFRESGSGSVVIDSGTLNLGGNDAGSAGLLSVYGGATGEGGEIRIHPSAAEDTTVDHWSIDVATDDLRVFNSLGDLALSVVVNGAVDLYHDGGHKFSTTASGIALNGGQTSQISIKSTGGSGFTQGAIVIEGHPSDSSPGTRGQGIYYFNEGNDRTYYSGTLYNNGTVWGVASTTGTSLATAAANTTNSLLAVDGVSGGVRIGTTSNIFNSATNERASIKNPSTGAALTLQSTDVTGGFPILYVSSTDTTAGQNAVVFQRTGGVVGTITTTASATAYNTSSDYRLKQNVTALTGAIDRVKTLSPKRFSFIAEPDKTVDGFLAHEVTTVPEAIVGTKDQVDDDGNPVYQGIDQSKLVPLLTAALQEAVAKIESLETRITALEAN